MSLIFSSMAPKKSPLWQHFEMPDGNFRKAVCNHCAKIVTCGGENVPKSKCVNRTMHSHMQKMHPDIMVEVAREQEILKYPSQTIDPRNESVRGTIPIFNLRTQTERARFIKLVCVYLIITLYSETSLQVRLYWLLLFYWI